jgi:hypothetical protein
MPRGIKRNIEKEIIKAGQKEIFENVLKSPAIQRAYAKVLLDSGLAQSRISETTGLSLNKIREIKTDGEDDENEALLTALRDLELSRLYYISSNILTEMEKPEKLAAMKGGDLAYTYKTILDTRRLLENKSTSNIAIVVQSINKRMDDEASGIERLLQQISRNNPKETKKIDKDYAKEGIT